MKTKTIILSLYSTTGSTSRFRVEKATDSTEYLPGAILSKDTVDSLCRANHWKVTIVEKSVPPCG